MSNETAERELREFIARVESLVKLNSEVAKEAAAPVGEAVKETASAAKTPTGESWPDRKEGGKALKGVASAISAVAKTTRVVVMLAWPWVPHQWGAGGSSTTKEAERSRARTARKQKKTGKKSKFHAPRRQILPVTSEPIPDRILETVKKAAAAVFERLTKK